jgi:hypothetical protein
MSFQNATLVKCITSVSSHRLLIPNVKLIPVLPFFHSDRWTELAHLPDLGSIDVE